MKPIEEPTEELTRLGRRTPKAMSQPLTISRNLGVNVVQLQPVTDRYKTYDEDGNVLYNWGYDVQNYSAPETSYSTKPHDPKTTMRELKEMIHAYHEAGIFGRHGCGL